MLRWYFFLWGLSFGENIIKGVHKGVNKNETIEFAIFDPDGLEQVHFSWNPAKKLEIVKEIKVDTPDNFDQA